jgi:hypothetical protein
MWFWTGTEIISWTDDVKNEEDLQTVKKEKHVLKKLKERRLTCVVTSYLGTCLKHVTGGKIEGRIEMTGRRGRRRKKLQDGLKEKERILKIERGNNR